MKFVLSGEEIYEIGGRSYRLRAGEFMLVPENVALEARTSGAGRTVGLCIYFPASASHLPSCDIADLANMPLMGSSLDPLSGLLRSRAAALAADVSDAGAQAKQIIDEAVPLAMDFAARFERKVQRLSALKPSTRVEVVRRLERSRSLMHERAGSLLSLAELAAEANLSAFQLSRSFAEVYGSPRWHTTAHCAWIWPPGCCAQGDTPRLKLRNSWAMGASAPSPAHLRATFAAPRLRSEKEQPSRLRSGVGSLHA